MSVDKWQKKCAEVLESGEQIGAAVKSTPRGSVHETILGAAGGVAGGTVAGPLAGAGLVLGQEAGSDVGQSGRAEREQAGVDVGTASQILVAVTDRRLALIKLSALGKGKELLASVSFAQIASVEMGTTSIFGQKMAEIVVTMASGAEAGFGVAKVHRKDGDEVLAALSGLASGDD